MVLYNLTHNPSLQPSGAAIDLFEQTLLRTDRHYYQFSYRCHPEFEELWGCWMTDDYNSRNYLHHCYHHYHDGIEWLLMQSIPVFVVNHAISGREVFCPALQQHIPVPHDVLPNIQIGEKRKDDDKQDHDEPYPDDDRRYKDDRKPRYRRSEMQFIDVWGMFTILEDAQTPRPHHPYEMGGTPAIFIWMDKIVEATDTDEHGNMLFAKVMLHEFAHALMHIGKFGSGDFYKWREESLANAYALGKIKATGDAAFYDYAKSVALKQPENYALGAKYADAFDLDDIFHFMRVWYGIKGNYCIGYDAPQLVKDRWLDYVKNSKTLDGRKLHLFDTLMETDAYLYENELYEDDDLVWQVMKDYTESHPELTLDEIKDAFPNYLNKDFTMYDVWPKADSYEAAKKAFESRDRSHLRNNIANKLRDGDETRFCYEEDQILHAADTDFVISDYWHPDSMPGFLEAAADAGIKIELLK